MRCIASCSCGKDSLAMVLKLIEDGWPLTDVVFFDTGMEFSAIYRNLERLKDFLEEKNIRLTVVRPETDFLFDMLVKPHTARDGSMKYGYDWCGRNCRWRTTEKVSAINRFLKSLGDDYIQYIGIAADEPARVKDEANKRYPLIEWGMTEKDCLNYCYLKGWDWLENDVDLYQILDRVSCWCCWNKNLKELRNIRKYLPETWQKMLGLQSRIGRPFRGKETLFDLDKRFEEEGIQLTFNWKEII